MTHHKILFENSSRMAAVPDGAAHLVVTSPPYPMISMWDQTFADLDPAVTKALDENDGDAAFELMHLQLDKVWAETYRALCPGGIACINIGDAVRTIDGRFQLFSSHARILTHCLRLGFQPLPAIIWRKQTNAPNKFMGSGMLPPGAYVTLEHEFIIVLRKGNKRTFASPDEKRNRAESAYFWEERNNWFSDVWFDLKGATQRLAGNDARARSGAFPFELPYRLINMFSVKGDTVLDPFLGTGVTAAAAAASERNSIGYELDRSFEPVVESSLLNSKDALNERIRQRVASHLIYIKDRESAGKPPSKRCVHHGFPCISAQEKDIIIRGVKDIRKTAPGEFEADYEQDLARFFQIP